MRVINKYISASDKAVNGVGDVYLYGEITNDEWFDTDVTPTKILDTLNGFENVSEIKFHINSFGGSCFAGNAIVSVMDSYRRKNTKTQINAYIEGVAASMATSISSACDNVYMTDNSLFMVHKPWGMAIGNAEELERSIVLLNKTEDTLIANMMRKFKGTEDELRDMLAAETWMNADEAKEWGFVDEVISGIKIAACANGIRIGNEVFGNKIADMMKNKYPNIKFKKEEKELQYNEELKNFGIDETAFNAINLEGEKILEIANLVKDSIKGNTIEQFMDKATALEKLGCEDISAEEILDYAKAGMNPVDTTEFENKANEYDKIMKNLSDQALTYAVKAQGDKFNENRTKKLLSVLSYDEIVDQMNEWENIAKCELHAGVKVSTVQDCSNSKEEFNPEDYKI